MGAGGAGMIDQREKTRGSASQTTGASPSVLCGAGMPAECRAELRSRLSRRLSDHAQAARAKRSQEVGCGVAASVAAPAAFSSFFVWARAAAVMRFAIPVKITPWNGTSEYQ
jgi:hypothetical protein